MTAVATKPAAASRPEQATPTTRLTPPDLPHLTSTNPTSPSLITNVCEIPSGGIRNPSEMHARGVCDMRSVVESLLGDAPAELRT